MRRTPGLRALGALVVVAGLAGALATPSRANGILVGPDGSSGGGGRRSPLSLRDHRVEAVLQDRVASVQVLQTFHSDADRPLEGTYLFPLPDGAVVSRFAMTMGGRMVEGEVVEATQAKAIYEGIVRQRRDPGLLEYVGRGLFRARVFPIEPRSDLTIRLSFEQVLPEDAGTLEFRYPLATDRLHGGTVPAVLVDVKVQSPVDLKALYSATHAVRIERDGERQARATYEASARRQDKDFLLYVARSPEDVGISLLSHRRVGEDGTFLLALAPRTDAAAGEVVPKDVVFVLDTSGSMAGEKIEQARRSLSYGITTLSEGDRFSVIAFSTSLHALREDLLPATREAKAAAEAWLEALTAEGGTNLEAALTSAVSPRTDGRLFLVVLLTDGRPTVGEQDGDALVRKVVAANEGNARIFTFGVGHDLDVALLDRIAEASRGTRDYVAPGEDLEIPTGRFFRKVNRPVLSHLALALGEGTHDVYPPSLSDLFAGEQVVVMGRYRQGGARTIRLTGRVGERTLVHEWAVTLREDEGAAFLPRLWAHRKVAYLLDQIRLHGQDPELVDAVRTLALRHGIVTPYTAGLVVEEHEMAGPRDLAAAGGPGTPRIQDAAVADHVETDDDLPLGGSVGDSGISDAPFTGAAINGWMGLGGGAGGAFRGRGGHRDLAVGGAGQRSEGAVEDDLRWLAAHQSPDGGWDAALFGAWCDGKPHAGAVVDGAGSSTRGVGASGAALCAFLGAGYTNRGRHPFAAVVAGGLRYLKNRQDAEGGFGGRDHPAHLLDHALAALAMVEAYGMTESPVFRGSAQKGLDYLVATRNRDGVWGGTPDGGTGDLLATGLAMLPVKSACLVNADAASRGRHPPLAVDPAILDAVRAFVEARTDPGTGRVGSEGPGVGVPRPAGLEARFPADQSELSTAIGLLARIFAGEDPRRSDAIQRGARLLAALPPVWDLAAGDVDELYWWFGALAMVQVGGAPWTTWNAALKTALIDNQRRDTEVCEAKGSWDPVGPWGLEGGRVLTTALFAMCLEVYYRYDKVFGVKDPAPAAPPPDVQQQTKDSEAIRDLKDDVAGAERDGSDGLDGVRARIRRVGDRTFARRGDGCWVETAWDGTAEPVKVEAFTEAYFALLARGGEVPRVLAVAEHVLFLLEGNAYEVVPPPAK